MPIPLSWTDIKAITEVGDSPSNDDRADVWDTIALYIQQAESKAEDAVNKVNAIAARSVKASGFIRIGSADAWTYPALPNATLHRANGCEIEAVTAYAVAGPPTLIYADVEVIFDDENDDEFYPLRLYALGHTHGAGLSANPNIAVPTLIAPLTKTKDGFTFRTPNIQVAGLNGPGYKLFFFEAMA